MGNRGASLFFLFSFHPRRAAQVAPRNPQRTPSAVAVA